MSVLVVGAGPSGLAAALELRRHGVDVRVVDAADRIGTGTRSILAWPPLLALLGDHGLLAEARELGIPLRSMTYHSERATLARVTMPDDLAALVLPQSRMDALLERGLRRAGVEVERGVRVDSVVQNGREVLVGASGPDGELLEFRTSWLIAADGSHSAVRDLLGVTVDRSPLPHHGFLAEGRLAGQSGQADFDYVLTRQGILLIAPLPGGLVRIAGEVERGQQPTAETIRRLLRDRAPFAPDVTDIGTVSTFGAAEGIATALRQERCFLIGDAAHTHSPMGGQGANLGVQDARNLAWKLAGVITGRLVPAILDTYEPERRGTAERAIRMTGSFTRTVLLPAPWDRLRNGIMRTAHLTGVLNRWYPRALSGLRVSYPFTELGCPAPTGKSGRRLVGKPAPAWARGFESGSPHTYLLATAGPPSLNRLAAEVASDFPGLVVHRHTEAGHSTSLLIRPDGYVAAAGDTGVAEARDLLTLLAP